MNNYLSSIFPAHEVSFVCSELSNRPELVYTIFAERNAPHVSPYNASPHEVILKNWQSLKTKDAELSIAANSNLPGVSVQKLQLKEEKNPI